MSSSIIKLEGCQLDEIFGGSTGKEVAKYAIKVTCRILGGAIAGAGVGCGVGYLLGCESVSDYVLPSFIFGFLGVLGSLSTYLVDLSFFIDDIENNTGNNI